LKIPQDVACVSFDNFDFSEVVDPPMTTLESVEEEVGRKASQILLEKIKDKDTDSVSEYLVQPKLCIRKSCGCEKMIYKEE
jgi:LacI family transcriptional regulator